MIEAKSLYKNFGSVSVLKNVSFKLKKGEVVGFLGQNGAGKTTLMRILTTYLKPSRGCVEISDMNIIQNPLKVRAKIGYLPENPPLYSNMRVNEYLSFAAKIKGIPKNKINGAVNKVTHQCHLGEVTNKTISILSKGFKQRIGIAQALIHQPEILILDEPTNGLDPIQINQVRNLIQEIEDKTTVIISTHHLAEIEQLAKRVLIIKDGAIIADDTLNNLTNNKSTSLEEVFMSLHN